MSSRAQTRRVDFALALLLLVAYGWLFVFFPRINNPNELVRIYMARAIAERGSFVIGRREIVQRRLVDVGPLFAEWGWVNDRALVCDDPRLKGPGCSGFLYAGKAPGVSLMAAPIVFASNALFRAVANRTPSKDEYIFILRWLLAILPTVALWLVVRRFLLARGIDAPLALAATLAGACGSLSYTYGQMVAGHQPSGIALAIGFLAIFWPEKIRPRENLRALLVGALLPGAVLVEYQAAPAAMLILLAWIAVRWLPAKHRARLAVFMLCGALPMVALFAWFHTVVYGAPWRTAYSVLENAGFQRDIAPGFLGISLPTGERVWGSFFSAAMGLFFFAPWTALALGTLPLAWKRARRSWPFAPVTKPDKFIEITKITEFDNSQNSTDPSPVGAQETKPSQETSSPPAALVAQTLMAPETRVAQTRIAPASIAPIATPQAPAAARAIALALPSALSIVLYYLLFQSMHALWRSGWTVGPRYITPLCPFAAIAVALALQELAPAARALGTGLFGGAAAASIAATGLASSVCQGFPDEPSGPLAEVVAPLLSHGWVARNLLQLAGVPGLWSALPTWIALAVAAFFCLAAPWKIDAPPPVKKRALLLALAVASLLTLGQWAQSWHGSPWPSAAFLSSQWTPASPPGAEPFAR